MAEPILYGKALYYPHIEFNDNRWIKTAALYYDSLFRIVPDGYTTRDNRTVKSLIDHLDFIEALPTADEAAEIAQPFLSYIKREFVDEARRASLFQQLTTQANTKEPVLIHMKKMGQLLRDQLPLLQLASAPKDGHSNWFSFEPATAAIYMTFLANRLAAQKRVPVITDNAFYHPLVQGMQADNNNRQDTGSVLARLLINTVVPHDVGDIPVRKIIRFRKHHNDERLQFYTAINDMVQRFKDVTNEEVLQDILNRKQQEIKASVKNLQRAYKSIGIATAVGLLGLSIPAVAAGAGALIAGGAVTATATGKGVGAFLDYRKTKMASPHAYVLSLSRLKKETLVEQLLKGKLLL